MLLGDIEGNKYPLFLVMKAPKSTVPKMKEENDRLRHGFGRRVWREIESLQTQYHIQLYGNENAWWNGELTVLFCNIND